MLNEGVSKLAHPLFLHVIAQTHFLGQYRSCTRNLETRYLQAAISSKKRQLVVKRDKNTIE